MNLNANSPLPGYVAHTPGDKANAKEAPMNPRARQPLSDWRIVTELLLFAMTYRLEEYVRADGTNPYKRWFDSLDAQAAAKVVTAKLRMELGNTSSVKWYSGIGEYIIDWGPGYRIYLAKDGDALIVLFGGGTKRRQQTDIDRAKILHAEYKDRKAAQLNAAKKDSRKR